MEPIETVGGGIRVMDGQAPPVCPLCGDEVSHEVEQQEGLFIEVFIGCEECQIYWYSHEEPIL